MIVSKSSKISHQTEVKNKILCDKWVSLDRNCGVQRKTCMYMYDSCQSMYLCSIVIGHNSKRHCIFIQTTLQLILNRIFVKTSHFRIGVKLGAIVMRMEKHKYFLFVFDIIHAFIFFLYLQLKVFKTRGIFIHISSNKHRHIKIKSLHESDEQR